MTDTATIKAYLAADYRVDGEPGFTMRIGQPCQALAVLYAREGVNCCAFISACNPQGDASTAHLNDERQAAFARMLDARGLKFIPGAGSDPRGEWQAEPSYLVLGTSLEQSRAIGRGLDQNAIVWCGPDCVPALILLR